MGIATVNSLQGILKDFWLQIGVPQDLYTKASPAFQMLAKRPDTSWVGGADGAPEMKFGSKSGLPGAGSSDLANAWANPTNTSNVKWLISVSRYWQVMQISWDAEEFGVSPDGAYEDARLVESKGHVKRWLNVMSCYWWGNGGGAISRMDGTGLAIDGPDTITVINKRTMLRFEKGDRIQFATTDGTSGVVKAPVFEIIAKDTPSRTLTLDRPIVLADAILDNDHIFFAVNFGPSAVFQGFFSWCPLTGTQAATTFFGVDRSENVSALAGTRKRITIGRNPWNSVLDMLQEVEDASADIDVIFVSPTFWTKLMNSARPKSLMVAEGAGSMYSSPVSDDPDMLRYGVSGMCVRWSGNNRDVYIYSDRYLADINANVKDDSLIVGFKMDNWLLALSTRGLGWRDSDGNGSQYWIQGTEVTGSVYGAKGQIVNRDTQNQIVLGPNVVE